MDQIVKRDGTVVQFHPEKIKDAVLKALNAVGMPSESVSRRVTRDVLKSLDLSGESKVSIEDVQDKVETALMKRGLTAAAKSYILYREERARARKAIVVEGSSSGTQSVTDKVMMIATRDGEQAKRWDRSILQCALVNAGASVELAAAVAKHTEDCIIGSGLKLVGEALIREMANAYLNEHGSCVRLKEFCYKVPASFVDGLMGDKSNENSNIVNNNPEAVGLAVSELVLKQYALDQIFSEKVNAAHSSGMVYVHDLGYPVRVYCGSHSIEYIKKYGLKGLNNLNTTSKPAKSASVLTGHLNTFLASMQSCYAGALGLGFINVFYAPLLEGLSGTEIHQIAQELIFNGSQNAFSRGGQTLFLDFNIHTGVPGYLRDVPAIGPGGLYMWQPNQGQRQTLHEVSSGGDWCLALPDGVMVLREHDGKQTQLQPEKGRVLTYGDFEPLAMEFALALLDVWYEGDANGRIFEFPKCDFHVSQETLTVPEQYRVFKRACELAAHNGSTYFVFDRDAVTLSSCCRLRTAVTDMSLLKHPERLRTLGFQNVTVNVPQAAYRASRLGRGNLEGLFEEIDHAMDIAVDAHLQKRKFIERIMEKPGRPLWQLGKASNDGSPYVDLDSAMYIIGVIGVNDAVHFLTGKEMHESPEALEMGLQIAGHMYLRAKEYTEKYKLQFKIEESPAESAARKLAMTDLVFFHEEASKVFKGEDESVAYYTNSVHLAADAPVSLAERVEVQAKFNPIIEAGAITHAFIGEQQPSPEAIEWLIKDAFARTQSAQITFSPEFTYCNHCGTNVRGLVDKCPSCGSTDVEGETRIVGYFSKVRSWNLSKLAELRAREHGRYNVEK